MRRALIGLAALIVGAGLAGCSSLYWNETDTPMTRAMVIGTWTHDGPDGKQFRLRLDSDGTYELTDVPCNIDAFAADSTATTADWSCLRNGTGTWSIWQKDSVRMGTDSSANAAVTILEVDGKGGSPRLYVPIGDADAKVRFYLAKG